MRPLRYLGILLAAVSCLALAAKCPYRPMPVDGRVIELAGLEGAVRVVTDELGVPHIYAASDTDLAMVQGWIHARDRFFQMDSSRRQASGTYAELVGGLPLVDGSDPGSRILGLRLAAARSEALLTPSTRAILEAYAEGVNAYLADHPLSPEYSDLGITTVPEWSIIDSLVIGKAFDAQNQYPDSLDTALFDSYVAACEAATPPCDGLALLDEDVGRYAPMDPTSTIPDATGSFPFDPASPAVAALEHALPAGAGAAARRIEVRTGERSWLRGDAVGFGSNAWGVAAEHSATGHPMVANDAHLSLQTPSIFYENHLVVSGEPGMNLSGTTLPGIALVLTGLNGHIAWGTTVNYSDRSDAFLDRLLRDAPSCPVRLCIESEGELHPVEERSETYRYNNFPYFGVPDDLADGTFIVRASAPETVDVLTVPFRSFGPVVDVEDRSVVDDPAPPSLETTVTTWQYAGLHGTREIDAVALWARAQDVFEFREGVKLFAGVSENWVVGDVEGNLAYFTSGEIPLRSDLEAGSVVDRPDLIQDGSGPNNWIADPALSQGQTIPYQILPFDEMPQTVNPANGFVVTANNDPAGALLDNDPLNQYRPGRSSIYYANTWDFTAALRAGRITRLLREKIGAGEKISLDDMKRIQADTQQLDAELMVPFLLQADANAGVPGAPTELAGLAADPEVAEALARFAAWDFSTPTGIPEGYDESDVDGTRNPDVSSAEAEASIAATLYNVWRAHAVKNTMSRAVQAIGVRPLTGNFPLRGLQHLLSQDPFTGVGASGLDFFPEPADLAEEERRDVVLLQALRDALDDLASSRYADAFGGSTDQDDYRWGRLNRVSFPHPLGAPYSTPPGYFFRDLAENLPGLARDGGAETVSPTGIDPGASGAHAFESSIGSASRLVMAAGNPEGGPAPMVGWNAMPGGASGYPFSPFRENQLGIWLTADHHPILTLESEIQTSAYAEEQFVPSTP